MPAPERNGKAGRSLSAKCGALVLLAAVLGACDNPAPGEGVDHPPMETTQPEVTTAPEAVRGADLPKTDPETMAEAEFETLLPAGPRCTFAYTAESPPILAAAVGTETHGITKIHGRLVRLVAPATTDFEALTQGANFAADGLRVTVTPDPNAEWEPTTEEKQRRPAELHLTLEQGLNVGYRGWYICRR